MRWLGPVVYCIAFLDAFLLFTIVPLLPQYVEELDMSKTQAGIVVSVYSAVVLVAALPVGRLADRIGAKRLTLFGLVTLIVSTALVGVASEFWMLFLARAGQGLSSAISWTAGLAWLAGVGEERRRAALLSTAIAAGSLGGLLGPITSGPLAEALGLHAPFLIYAGLAGLLTLAALVPPETHGGEHREVTLPELARLTARSPALAAAALVTTLVATVSGVVETLVPLRMGEDGYSAVAISAVLGTAGLVSAVVVITVGRLYGRLDGFRVGIVAVIGMAVMTGLLTLPLAALTVGLVYILGAPSIGAQYAIAFPLAADGADRARLPPGAVLGVINVCWGLGYLVGPAVGSAIADLSSDQVAYALATLVSVAAVPRLRRLALAS